MAYPWTDLPHDGARYLSHTRSMAIPLTRTCGRLVAMIRDLRAQRRYRMAVAARIRSSPVRTMRGLWRGDGRLHGRSNRDVQLARKLFYGLYMASVSEGAGTSWWSRPLAASIECMLDVSSRRWMGDADRGPTAVFVSRDGSLKYFDFAARTVVTLVDADALDRVTRARACPIFGHFDTPALEELPASGAAQPRPASQLIVRQRMLAGPCLGLLAPSAQTPGVRSICRIYARYVEAESGPPMPELVACCLAEVAGCLEPSQRARLLSHESALLEFARSARTVESHLDFNVANFVADSGRWWIVDIADAGLRLPATYDANNILLNEAYQNRSTHLIDAALRSPVETGHHDVLQATIGRATMRDFKVSLVLNAVLRESGLVGSALRDTWHPSRVPHRWRLLERSIAGWPLLDA